MQTLNSPSLALLAALLVPACAPQPAARAAAGGDAEAAAPVLGDFTRDLLLTGELEAVHSVAINSPQTSVFQMRIQFMAEEGSVVKAGDPLLDFDNSALADRVLDLETQILDAEMQVVGMRSEIESNLRDLEIQLAETEYAYEVARLEAAVEAGILSRKEHGERQLAFSRATRELADARARIVSTKEKGAADLDVLIIQRDKLRQDLASAQQDLSLLSIKAPSDGLVIYETRTRSTVRYQPGDSCWPGQTIIRLPDLSAMQVAFLVNEVDARHLQVGMQVVIAMDSFPDRPLTGTIEQIPSMAVLRGENSQVKVFKVISSLSETWPGEMKPGMSVQGRVVVERLDSVPMVPRHMVRFDGRDYWLRPGAAGLARGDAPRQVHPVARNATYYVLDQEADAAVVPLLGLDAPAPSGRAAGAVP